MENIPKSHVVSLESHLILISMLESTVIEAGANHSIKIFSFPFRGEILLESDLFSQETIYFTACELIQTAHLASESRADKVPKEENYDTFEPLWHVIEHEEHVVEIDGLVEVLSERLLELVEEGMSAARSVNFACTAVHVFRDFERDHYTALSFKALPSDLNRSLDRGRAR
jgi:hypothetical protein